MRLVLASNNAKKLAELRQLLGELGVELVAQGQLGIAEAQEPHGTFVENALAKARHAARTSGGAALADDSGLCVPALGGEPGVRSAVFAGELPADPQLDRESRRRAQDEANNALLLRRLAAHSGAGADAGGALASAPRPGAEAQAAGLRVADVQAAVRAAYFVSTIVALRHADDPEPLIATGRWHGTVLSVPRGAGGFGYDPLLLIPSLGATVAELAPEVKNRFSHRAQAARALRELLATVWQL
jgi:XTP/dITP diphosphohydrolase